MRGSSDVSENGLSALANVAGYAASYLVSGMEEYMKNTNRSTLASVGAVVALALAGGSNAQVPESVWDGFVVVNGALQKDGTAIACRDKEANIQPQGHCAVITWAKGVRKGQPERMPLQELLEVRLEGDLPRGVSPRFIGVGPGFRKSSGKGGGVYYAEDMFVIYYKLRAAK